MVLFALKISPRYPFAGKQASEGFSPKLKRDRQLATSLILRLYSSTLEITSFTASTEPLCHDFLANGWRGPHQLLRHSHKASEE